MHVTRIVEDLTVAHSPVRYLTSLAGGMLLLACGPDSGDLPTALGSAASLSASGFSPWSEPAGLGPAINTTFSEQQPALSRDALRLYFMSTRPEHAEDAVLDPNLWVARRACVDCPWEPPVPLGPTINGPGNATNPTLSRDEHWLFFASTRPGSLGNDIWASYREHVHDDLGWGEPVNLGPGVNTAVNEAGPSYVENDGGAPQLYFQRQTGPMNAPSGDIFVSTLGADGVWGDAVPVEALNGPAADQRPSIRFDGRAIYFWSGRDAGRGVPGAGYLWYAERADADDPWSAPMLVEAPIADRSSIQPFIHSRGHTETLLFVHNVGAPGGPNDLDIVSSTRTRHGMRDE